jgi:hypothetical protein
MMEIAKISLEAWNKGRYQLSRDGQIFGPYSVWDVVRLYDQGQIIDTDAVRFVSTSGEYGEWKALSATNLFHAFAELRPLAASQDMVILAELSAQIETLTKITAQIYAQLRWIAIAAGVLIFIYLIFGTLRPASG